MTDLNKQESIAVYEAIRFYLSCVVADIEGHTTDAFEAWYEYRESNLTLKEANEANKAISRIHNH